jgi:hypothetical protein
VQEVVARFNKRMHLAPKLWFPPTRGEQAHTYDWCEYARRSNLSARILSATSARTSRHPQLMLRCGWLVFDCNECACV